MIKSTEQPIRKINEHEVEHSRGMRTRHVVVGEIQHGIECGEAGPLKYRYNYFYQLNMLGKREMKYRDQGHNKPPRIELGILHQSAEYP